MLYTVLVALLWIQGQPAGPADARATAMIVGRVIDAASGAPVPGVTVSLFGGHLRGAEPPKVMTDPQGRFIYRNLPPGSYELMTTKPGYIDGAYGRRRHDGRAGRCSFPRESERPTSRSLCGDRARSPARSWMRRASPWWARRCARSGGQSSTEVPCLNRTVLLRGRTIAASIVSPISCPASMSWPSLRPAAPRRPASSRPIVPAVPRTIQPAASSPRPSPRRVFLRPRGPT